jgi:hypothetical protein
VRYARRALALVARGRAARVDYVVTDVATLPDGPAQCVVFLQQRVLGLPVYGGRRSVTFRGRRTEVTGAVIPTSRLQARTPRVEAANAVRLAFRKVRGEDPPDLRRNTTFAAAEQFTSFEIGERGRAFTHLVVFTPRPAARPRGGRLRGGRGQPRLAWVVDLLPDGRKRHEVVVDAIRSTILRSRMTSQALEAEVRVPPAPGRGVLVPFEPAWSSRPISIAYNDRAWHLPATVGGVIAGAQQSEQHGLNAFCIANRMVDVVDRYVATSVPIHFELYSEFLAAVDDAAYADAGRIVLCGVLPDRYAVMDPAVVAHEVAHVVLNALVGGSTLAMPFERSGASRAVSEGLADFLGLTIWNDACRRFPPPPLANERFGRFFLGGGRDYAPYYAGNAVRIPATNSPHEAGRAVCGALLLARHTLVQAWGSEDVANATSWRIVLLALRTLPYQDELPRFCCVRRAVIAAAGPDEQTFAGAFDDMGIRTSCPHVRRAP